MRPALPLLPIELPCSSFLRHTPQSLQETSRPHRARPRSPRPPTLPSSHQTTWKSVVLAGTAQKMDADVVGVALLAAEARRRKNMVAPEKGLLGIMGNGASPLLRRRVQLLEKDVNGIVKMMLRAKAKVRAQIRSRSTLISPIRR